MPSFHNGDVEIAYLDEGEGEPIVLVHGFASSKDVNWVYPTWVSELKKAGRRVIALDNRGHGDSTKLYDPEDYHIGTMAGDVARADGSSRRSNAPTSWAIRWAARITAFLARSQPQRLRSAIFGGIGIGLIEGGGPGENVARGAGGGLARRRDRSGGADVPRLCRPDPLRPPGARRLPARLAPA